MKIEGQLPKLPVSDKGTPKTKNEGVGRLDSQKPAVTKKTETDGFTVSKMRSKIDLEPDINVDKVNALKAKIKKGEYKVDSKQLANNLLKDSIIEDV